MSRPKSGVREWVRRVVRGVGARWALLAGTQMQPGRTRKSCLEGRAYAAESCWDGRAFAADANARELQRGSRRSCRAQCAGRAFYVGTVLKRFSSIFFITLHLNGLVNTIN